MLVSARPRVFPRGLAVRIGKCVGRQSFADKALVDPVCRQRIADLLQLGSATPNRKML